MNAAVNLDTLARAMNEHAMVSLTDRDGRLVYVNDRLCAISGYARDELLGRDHRILKSEAYSPEFFARLWQSLARGEVRRAQLQNRHRDGSMYWVEATMLAEFDEDGVPIHYLVVRTDVTRRERLRAGFEALAHEAGEQTLGTIVQAMVEHLGVQRAGVAVAPSAEGDFDVVEFDRERGALVARHRREDFPLRAALAQAAGIAPHGDVALPLPGLPAWDAAGLRRQAAVALNLGAGPECGVFYLLHRQHIELADVERTLFAAAASRVESFVVRQRVERELRESEARMRALIDGIPFTVFTADYSGTVGFCSQRLLHDFGHPTGVVIGDDWWVLVCPEERARVAQGWQAFAQSGQPAYLDEFQILCASGQRRTVCLRVCAVTDGQRQLGLVGVLESVDELRQLERRLQHAQRLESLGTFVAGIAHDFNNILACVLGYAGLALKLLERTGDERAADYVRIIAGAGERGRELIARILTFSRREPTVGITPLRLHAVFHEACEMLRALLPVTMTLEVRSDPTVPAAAIDVVELEQVLLNLAVNARDAQGQHGRLALHLTEAQLCSEACVSCGETLEGHYVEIACCDDGPGIPDELRSRVFEPFFTTKPAGSGTGVGLAAVHGAVHRWGGHLLLATGRSGTTVRLLLPQSDSGLEMETSRAATSTALLPVTARDLRIAIVDDERSIAHLIAEILEMRGFRCVQFESSLQALGALMAEPGHYDLVVTDFGMPDLTGEELIAEMRAAGHDHPAVLCSGTPGVLDEDRARQLDIYCVLPKPLTPEQLVNAVVAAADRGERVR